MARIRTIKPEFFLDDDLAKLHPLTRLLFIGLWCIADKSGRLEDKPQKIKVQVLPYDKHDIDAELDVLSINGLIVRYEIDGRKYIQISTFCKHQRVHNTEKESDIPPYSNEATVKYPLNNGGETVAAGINVTGREGKGKEGKGKEKHGDAVFLTLAEFEKLVEKNGEEKTKRAIEILDRYIMSKGKKYNSHYHTILGWPLKEAMNDTGCGTPTTEATEWGMKR